LVRNVLQETYGSMGAPDKEIGGRCCKETYKSEEKEDLWKMTMEQIIDGGCLLNGD